MCIDAVRRCRRCTGVTLIELIVFIVIVGVGIAGILAAFNVSVKNSADPVVRKHMLAIAEALLEEVQGQPYCLAGDADCPLATGGSCNSTPADRSALGQVGDYAGCNLSSRINDVSGSGSYLAPDGYSAHIDVHAETFNSAEAARIVVTVCRSATAPCPAGGESLTVEGYRARYWPDSSTSW